MVESYFLHNEEIVDENLYLEQNKEEKSKFLEEKDKIAQDFFEKSNRDKIKQKFSSIEINLERGIIVPTETGEFQIIRRRKNSPILVKHINDSTTKKIVDAEDFSDDKNVRLRFKPITDGKKVAFGISEKGRETYNLRVFNLEEDEVETYIEDIGRGFSISWGEEGFYYTYTEKGDSSKTDLYHFEPNKNKRKLVKSFGHNEWPIFDVNSNGDIVISVKKPDNNSKIFFDKGDGFKEILSDKRGYYAPFITENYLYLLTDNEAPKRRLLRYKNGKLTEIISEKDEVLNSFRLTEKGIVCLYEEEGNSRLRYYSREGQFRKSLEENNICKISCLSSSYKTSRFFYRKESFVQAPVNYFYDEKCTQPNKFNNAFDLKIGLENFEIRKKYLEVSDSLEMPIYMVGKSIEEAIKKPTLIKAYGGFSKSLKPSFNRYLIPFLNEGGIYIQTCLRGGGEFGREWHEKGKKEGKKDTINDLIATAEYLIDENYTNSSKLGCIGRSNGGLITLASIIKRPDLFQAAVLDSPLTDMLRFHKFKLGSTWKGEYGDPENPDEFSFLKEISPYHNIEEDKDYPSLLFQVSETDSRVDPLHSIKMVKRLEDKSGDGSNKILIRNYKERGHSDYNQLSSDFEQEVDKFTFLYKMLI
ncbi:MAG: prolyl oligopeptidase family serine peptidase [Candidatus Paceibacteria bacterium]